MSIRTAIVLAVASVVSASGVASQKSLCRDLIDFHSRSVKQVSELAKVLTNDSGKTDPITLSVIRLSAVMKADASALKVASANKNEGCLLSGSTGLVESVITEYINAFESLSKPVAGATGVMASIMPEFARKQMMAWKDMLTRVHMSNAFSQLGMYDTLTSKIFGKFASPIMDRSGSKSFRGIGRSRGGLDRRSHQSHPPHPEPIIREENYMALAASAVEVLRAGEATLDSRHGILKRLWFLLVSVYGPPFLNEFIPDPLF